MSLAATGAQSLTAAAAVQAMAIGAVEPALATPSDNHTSGESSFAMVENTPQLSILPVPGGLWREAPEAKAGLAADGLGLAGIILLMSLSFTVMNFFTRSLKILGVRHDAQSKESTPASEFVPFMRRDEVVSPYNPVRIGGEELPGKSVKDPEALGRMFGKKGIQ